MSGFILFKTIVLDPILSLIYFPFWWYSVGLKNFIFFLKRKIQEIACPFVLKILFLNLTKPMYGDYTREGKIISFFMRLIHLFWRLLRVLVVLIFSLLSLLFYLFILPLVIYKIICLFNNSCFYFFPGKII
jgi:hypothetical protein